MPNKTLRDGVNASLGIEKFRKDRIVTVQNEGRGERARLKRHTHFRKYVEVESLFESLVATRETNKQTITKTIEKSRARCDFVSIVGSLNRERKKRKNNDSSREITEIT